MAASDSTPLPLKNQALRITFPLWLTTGLINSGAAGLDSEVSLDNGSFADCTNEATEIGSSGTYYLDLVQAEMNADVVAIQVKSSTTDAITYKLTIYPSSLGKMQVDVQSNAGTAITSASGVQEVKVASIAANAITAAAIATDAIDADALAADAVSEIQSGLSTLNAAGVRTAVGLASANLDTQLADLPTNAELATALGTADDAVLAQVALVKAQTDLIPADPAAVGDIPTAVQNADAWTARNIKGGSDGGRTNGEAVAFLRNRWTVVGTTITIYDTDDSTPLWTGTVTSTPGADPITGNNPA